MSLDFKLGKEQQELQKRAGREFDAIRDQYATTRPSLRQTAALDAVWSALVNLGFPGFVIPERYGGSDRGVLSAALVLEKLAEAGLHSFLPILSTMDTVCIVQHGSEAAKEKFLPRIASGGPKLCFGATEDEAGFNVFNIKTYAEHRNDHFVVNGGKVYVSGMDIADYMLLVARTMSVDACRQQDLPKTHGLSLLMVETSTKGIERKKMPSRGEGVLTQFAVTLKDVRVPAENLVGEEHGGAKVMFASFNPERILGAATALGVARYCLEEACKHAKSRKVFGNTPIGEYQAIQHPLAETSLRIRALQWVTYHAAWLFDSGAPPSEVAEAANAAKFLAAETAQQAVDAAIDTFGGKGFDEEYGVVHLLEFARFLQTAPISNHLILNQTAEHVLGLPRSY